MRMPACCQGGNRKSGWHPIFLMKYGFEDAYVEPTQFAVFPRGLELVLLYLASVTPVGNFCYRLEVRVSIIFSVLLKASTGIESVAK